MLSFLKINVGLDNTSWLSQESQLKNKGNALVDPPKLVFRFVSLENCVFSSKNANFAISGDFCQPIG